MANYWIQNSFAGTFGTHITTLVPSTPPSGASYTDTETSVVCDGSNNVYRNLSTAGFADVELVGWSNPAGNVFTNNYDVWIEQNVTQTLDFLIKTDANNFYQIRVTNSDASHVSVDVYRTLAGTLTNPGAATQIALSPSVTQSAISP